MNKIIQNFLQNNLMGEVINIISNAKVYNIIDDTYNWQLDNSQVTIKIDKEGIISLFFKSDKYKEIENFKKYLDNLDEDIFLEATDSFKLFYGEDSFKKLSESVLNKYDSEMANKFKELVKDAVTHKIDKLTNLYLK